MNIHRSSPEIAARSPGVRRHARDVALSASLIALVVYLIAAALADILVLHHFQDTVDARLLTRLEQIAKSTPATGSPRITLPGRQNDSTRGTGGDLDDAPVFAWWRPLGTQTAVPLESDAPALSVGDRAISSPSNLIVEGRQFRLRRISLPKGQLVVGTSIQQLVSVRNTLLFIEGSLLPVILVTFFVVATLIGRRAAAPVELVRQQQLDFTADASHELRTPLSVIEAEIGLALSTRRSGSDYREALERVGHESKRLRGIVEDLLWLARLDSIPAAPPYEVVSLASTVERCSDRFVSVAAERHIKLATIITDADELNVNAPAEWLERLVSVLIDNSCRYTNENGIIEVTAAKTNGRPTVTVDDTGPGISEKDRPVIFRRFHRANNKPGGAGLGLAIADTIVKATGGQWNVGEGEAGGAHVQISWPASD